MKKIIVIILMLICLPCFAQDYQLSNEYRTDMEKVIDRILNEKLTYDKRTLGQMLIDFENKSDKIYAYYLKNKQISDIDFKEHSLMAGMLGAYSIAICDEFKPVIKKYKLNIVSGSACDIYLYDEFIKKYNIRNSEDFKKLVKKNSFVTDKVIRRQWKIEDSFNSLNK